MPRAVSSRTLPRVEVLLAGPFRGMRDAPEPTTTDMTLALLAQNMVRAPGPDGGGLTGRPGFAAMGSSALGSGSTRTCQALTTWTKPDGVRQTVAIVGGKVYAYDWTTEAFTEVVTAANLATASITLSTTARVALVPFADGLVVSDSTNTPWWWDGTTGAGGLSELTNAPVFYGPPTVRDSRLLGIKYAGGDRMTLVWSEPGTPNTGYEAGGYVNAWDNPGGYAQPLEAVCGTNEALYVFRERVSLAILGNVTADWSTAGTRANLSPDVGTRSPWAVHPTANGVMIVDADAQPWLMRIGEPEPIALWKDCRQTVRGTPRAYLSDAQIVQDDATYTYWLGLPEVDASQCTQWLGFAQDDLQFVGVSNWGAASDRAGMVVDGDGVARWAHAGVNDGRLYVHGDLESGPWNDALNAAANYIAHAVVSGPLGYDLDRELLVQELEAAITGTGVTRVSVSYETPRGQSTPLVATLDTGGGLTWDVDDWDEANWAGVTRDQKVRIGTLGRGRWLRVRVSHSESGEPFGVLAVRARCVATQGSPRGP